MAFASDATLPIRPLNLAVKRERLRNLAIEMDGYDVTQVVGMLKIGKKDDLEFKLFSINHNELISRCREN